MKLYIKTFSIIFLMGLGIHTSMAQEKIERKMSQVQSQMTTDEDNAKQQTENINQLVHLSDAQVTKVHTLYLYFQKRMNAAASEMDEEKKAQHIKQLKALRNSKLKEILTEDQLTIFLKSERNE